MEYLKLNNGLECPALGIGTFMLSPKEAENAVSEALKDGYTLIDTANAYENEVSVGRAIKNSGVPREKIFLSTKLWPTEFENHNAVKETLKRLDIDYVDLLYIHQPAGNWQSGYKKLEEAYKEGKTKALGISNFESKYLERIAEVWDVVPQFIQVEAHPYFPQTELVEALKKYDMKLMAWYPLGHGDKKLIEEPIFTTLGKKYNKTPSQVILRWHIQMGFCVIPGSKSAEHIKENIDIFDFKLTDDEMGEIAKLNNGKRYYTQTQKALDKYAATKPNYEKQ